MPERPRLRTKRMGLGLLVAIAIVAANSAYVSTYTGFVHGPQVVSETDHLRYIEMAKGASRTPWRGLAYEAPFCYRVLTPTLVGLIMELGFSLDVAFFVLTHLFLIAFLFTLYLYLGTFELETRDRVLALILVGLMQGAVRWYSYQYWMTDPLAMFLIALAFLCVRTERVGVLFALSIVGVTARESYVLVFVYLFLHTWRTHGLSLAFERTLAVAIAPIALLVWIRASADALAEWSLFKKLSFFLVWRFERLFENQLYICTIGTFGVLLPLVLLFPTRMFGYWKRHPDELAVIAIVYGSLFLGNNTDRLLAYALPGLLPVAMLNFRALVTSTQLPFAAVAGAALVAQAVLYRQTIFTDWHAVSVSQPFNGLAAGSILAFWLAAAAAAYFRRANGGVSRPVG